RQVTHQGEQRPSQTRTSTHNERYAQQSQPYQCSPSGSLTSNRTGGRAQLIPIANGQRSEATSAPGHVKRSSARPGSNSIATSAASVSGAANAALTDQSHSWLLPTTNATMMRSDRATRNRFPRHLDD